jgi:hypothetical protein
MDECAPAGFTLAIRRINFDPDTPTPFACELPLHATHDAPEAASYFVLHAFSSQLVVITGGAEHNGNTSFCHGPILMVHGLRFLQPGARVLPL